MIILAIIVLPECCFPGFSDKAYVFTFEDTLPIAKEYLEEKCRIHGGNPAEITQEEVDTMHWKIKMNWIVRTNILHSF